MFLKRLKSNIKNPVFLNFFLFFFFLCVFVIFLFLFFFFVCVFLFCFFCFLIKTYSVRQVLAKVLGSHLACDIFDLIKVLYG